MPDYSPARLLDDAPEAFVSTTAISREVSRRLRAGRLRKLASRLYTTNMADPPETVIRRNLWSIVAGYFPGALVADRTALENEPAPDGSVFLVTGRGSVINLPGITLRPRRGADRTMHGASGSSKRCTQRSAPNRRGCEPPRPVTPHSRPC